MQAMLAEPLKILIADDDAGVRDLVCIRLRIAGYDPHMAKNGREAVERAVSLRPAAMILDLNMPELDGFGVLSEMQDKAPEIQVPTLVLTARQSSDDVRMAVALGARGYLTKPFTEAQLLARVTGLLRRPNKSRMIDEADVVDI
jgi:two-component system OmpR family response regulator